MAADDSAPLRIDVLTAIPRASRAETRNPLLKLPIAQAFAAMPPHSTKLLSLLLTQASIECRELADYCWSRRKAFLGAYWAKWAVEMRHARGLLNKAIRTGVMRLVAVDRDVLHPVLLSAPCTCPEAPSARQVCGRCRLLAQVDAAVLEDASGQ